MTRFDRYLLRTILATSLIALAFLLAVDYIVQISVDADDLGQGNYTLAVLLLQLLLVLPEKLLLYTPAAVLIGTIMGLGQLAAQNEIAVVRAAGISRLRLARAGIAFALIVGVLNIVNGETLAPQLADHIHIGALNPDGSLARIRSYHSDADSITISEAERATWQAPDWQLENPRAWRTRADKTETVAAPERWQNGATPQALQALSAVKSAETLRELYTLTRFMAANGLNHQQQSLKLWQRLLTPLTTAAMVLLALPFTFGNARSGQQGTRLVTGILLGVAYYVISGVIANLALLLNWPPLLGAALPILIFTIPPLILLMRQ